MMFATEINPPRVRPPRRPVESYRVGVLSGPVAEQLYRDLGPHGKVTREIDEAIRRDTPYHEHYFAGARISE